MIQPISMNFNFKQQSNKGKKKKKFSKREINNKDNWVICSGPIRNDTCSPSSPPLSLSNTVKRLPKHFFPLGFTESPTPSITANFLYFLISNFLGKFFLSIFFVKIPRKF